MAFRGDLARPPRATQGLISLSWVARAGAALVVLAALWLFLRGLGHPASEPLFHDLAVALRHGRLGVDRALYDTTSFQGHNYVPLGPFPAVLMIPLVATGDVLGREVWLVPAALALTIPALLAIFGALAVGSRAERTLLALATLAGTTYLAAAIVNSSYFIAGVVVVALLAWALLLALKRRLPLVAGILVGMAAATRATALLAIIPVAALYVEARPTARLRVLTALLAGIAPAILLLGFYNRARFGSPVESGYGLQTLAFAPLRAAREQGIFALVHVPRNLYYLLLSPPGVGLADTPDAFRLQALTPSDWGTGLLWISPWMGWAAFARGRRAAILAAGAALVILPSLLYYGVGWIQFGYRYALDALPLMAALAGLGWQRTRHDRLFAAAVAYSITANALGAAWLLWRLGA